MTIQRRKPTFTLGNYKVRIWRQGVRVDRRGTARVWFFPWSPHWRQRLYSWLPGFSPSPPPRPTHYSDGTPIYPQATAVTPKEEETAAAKKKRLALLSREGGQGPKGQGLGEGVSTPSTPGGNDASLDNIGGTISQV